MLSIFIFILSLTLSAQEDFYHPELEWRTIQTEHFNIHYHPGVERTARVVAKIAEDIYEPVTSFYQYKPDSKISFIMKDYDDFSNGATYFFDNKIEIWASALDFDLRGSHNWLRNVITHEFTHMIQIQTTLKFGRKVPAFYLQWLQYESERRTDVLYGYPNGIVSYPVSGFVVPAWFAEGVAQYNRREFAYDWWDAHRDMILRMYILDGNMLSWNQMATFGKTSLGNESAYNSGFALVRYIAERYGEDKLREISYNLRSLTAFSIDGAIEKAIGKGGKELYNEWINYLRNDYGERISGVKANLISGEIIGSVGFGNFYPHFSPDGKSIAYISNKESDYFGTSSLYLYDINSKKEKLLKAGVRSNFSWSRDGKKIYYSKLTRDNPHWSNIFDIFCFDLESEEDTRITTGLRADAPSVSPDGSKIVYVSGADGTLNISTMDLDGNNVKQLTSYKNGEQIFNPSWSPDGLKILFDYSIKDGRDLALIPTTGGQIEFVFSTPDDERNGTFTSDGKSIIFSSDKTGIFNIYEYDIETKQVVQKSNVLGGAFMPNATADGQIAFASYTSTGYKIAYMETMQCLGNVPSYVRSQTFQSHTTDTSLSSSRNWKSLRFYDDTQLPEFKEGSYKASSSGLAFIPFLRVDNYNPKNKGIDMLKLGLYMYSYDVLDRYGFFAGGAINKKGERDLFLTFDYRGKVPGLFQLGAEPTVAFEVYNITRKTDVSIGFPLDTLSVGVTYNLLEFDAVFRHKLFLENLDLELRYAHSRYSATIGSFILPDPSPEIGNPLIPAFSDLYLIGNNISANFEFRALKPSRTTEINPIGRKIRLKYEFETNKYNPTGEYDYKDGALIARYQRVRFHRLETRWTEYTKLPGWKHTLSAQLRGGTIFGPPQDNFFNYYIGGLAGMKGYTFYSLGGNEYAMANATYRFPIFEDIDTRILHMIFNQLYGAVYGDIGNAWTGGGLTGKKFKKDAGVELRLEAFSYYAFPTRIFLSATYGFDKFNYQMESSKKIVTYGKEWSFHFGVLFGFDFD
ncbi:MAG: PD40 domain-containing protein [Ignavibacteriales bacterium]|nr:PD40 domain-containing protein [Ignavibacteriales bacterium]